MALFINKNVNRSVQQMVASEKQQGGLVLVEREKGIWTACSENVFDSQKFGHYHLNANEICRALELELAQEGRTWKIKKSDLRYNEYTIGHQEYNYMLNGNETKRSMQFIPYYSKAEKALFIAPNSLRTLCYFKCYDGGRVKRSAYADYGYTILYIFSMIGQVQGLPSIGSVVSESGEPFEVKVKQNRTPKVWVTYSKEQNPEQEEVQEEERWSEPAGAEPIGQFREELTGQYIEEPEEKNKAEKNGKTEDSFGTAEQTSGAKDTSFEPSWVNEGTEEQKSNEPEKTDSEKTEPENREVKKTEPEKKEPEKKVPEYVQPEYFTLFNGRRIRRAAEFRTPSTDIYWADDKDLIFMEKEGMKNYVENGCGIILINSNIYFNLSGDYHIPCIKLTIADSAYQIRLYSGLGYTKAEKRLGKRDYSEVKQGILKLILYKISSQPDNLLQRITEAEEAKDPSVYAQSQMAADCAWVRRKEENCVLYQIFLPEGKE